MIAKLVAVVTKQDKCWDALVEAYTYEYRLEDLTFEISKNHREVFVEPREEWIDGLIKDENLLHILVWDKGENEKIKIYEKITN